MARVETYRRARTASAGHGAQQMKFFPAPLRYEPEGYLGGPAVLDAKSSVVAALFWPLHDPDDTMPAEIETHALGRAMARSSDMLSALRECQQMLAHLARPPKDAVPSIVNAWAQCVEIELRARRLLEDIGQ